MGQGHFSHQEKTNLEFVQTIVHLGERQCTCVHVLKLTLLQVSACVALSEKQIQTGKKRKKDDWAITAHNTGNPILHQTKLDMFFGERRFFVDSIAINY